MFYHQSFELRVRHWQLEGFRVGRARCLSCRSSWLPKLFPHQAANKLDCPVCHYQPQDPILPNNEFYEFPQVVIQR